MKWNEHTRLQGEHAFLSASKYAWLNYDEEKLRASYFNAQAAAQGTRLHALAAEHIRLSLRMPRNSMTFNQYVNDAIGFKMQPEQVLFYSVNCFGTADAIVFDEKKSFLRIHDLKTGTSRASMMQLYIYMALFCLEYSVRPGEIDAELRIYQNDDVLINNPETDEIARVIGRIITFDKIIEEMKSSER